MEVKMSRLCLSSAVTEDDDEPLLIEPPKPIREKNHVWELLTPDRWNGFDADEDQLREEGRKASEHAISKTLHSAAKRNIAKHLNDENYDKSNYLNIVLSLQENKDGDNHRKLNQKYESQLFKATPEIDARSNMNIDITGQSLLHKGGKNLTSSFASNTCACKAFN